MAFGVEGVRKQGFFGFVEFFQGFVVAVIDFLDF